MKNHRTGFPELHIHALTLTEIAIARLLVLGLTEPAIAARRMRSPTTVRLQIRMLKIKLQVESRAALLDALRQLALDDAAPNCRAPRAQ